MFLIEEFVLVMFRLLIFMVVFPFLVFKHMASSKRGKPQRSDVYVD